MGVVLRELREKMTDNRGSHSVVMNAVDDSVLGRWAVLSKMYQGGGSG
jgi:hypothetical protein